MLKCVSVVVLNVLAARTTASGVATMPLMHSRPGPAGYALVHARAVVRLY